MNEKILERWKEDRQVYIDEASELVGEWVNDYERHPDTGAVLADNGYYSNEDEIEEKARKLFSEYILEETLSEWYDRDEIIRILEEEY